MTTTTSEKVEKRPRRVRLQGRVLYLTENQDTLKAQLSGDKALKYDAKEKLIDNISTDEMTPGWVCFWYDETLGHYAFVGLRGGNVEKDAIWKKGFQAIASGKSKGCGSSRETAPYAEKAAGVEIVFAQNIDVVTVASPTAQIPPPSEATLSTNHARSTSQAASPSQNTVPP